MREAADILRALAWPIVALTALLLLRSEIRLLFASLSAQAARLNRIKAGKVVIELAEEIARGAIVRGAPDVTPKTDSPLQEFDQLAKQYDELSIESYSERVDARRRLADRLGALAVELRLPRVELSESSSEGKLVALATAAMLTPKTRDILALEKAAQRANFNFTRYRIALALVPTLARPDVGARTLERVREVLDEIEQRSPAPTHESLQRIIDRVRATAD